jgi:hypothetical protein
MQKYHAELTVEENLMAACWYCHIDANLLNGYISRRAFWQQQVKRFGEAHMRAWLASLPLKVKPRFE